MWASKIKIFMIAPLVSIIIPAYNVQDYIEECINSALNQTYPYIEIIVVDNNSTDQTAEKVVQIQKQFPLKIFLFFEEKQGVSFARNKGIKNSNGQWIQFLDADDLLYADKLERQLKLINTSKVAPLMVVGAYHRLSEEGKLLSVPLLHIGLDPYKSITASLLGHLDSNLFPKEILISVVGFEETLKVGEDTDLLFRILCLGDSSPIVYDYTPSAVYRQRNCGQLTKSDPISLNTDGLKVRLSIINTLKNNKPEYYGGNSDYFIDYVYFFIYRIGIYDINYAYTLYLKYLGRDYKPKLKSEVIAKHHTVLFYFLGFKNLMKCRWWVKSIFNKSKKGIRL